ncbi:hypothetical protein PVK06_029021 [Gossypium arboreum]|uniref:Uncharacterized protein n=1 Tax=Gossypium arboreum TaxID=29729 RepID=A0ABR0P5F5_GOSAR|nr:hypothetical protein PVK06_029021 [Gossypium arboreum]
MSVQKGGADCEIIPSPREHAGPKVEKRIGSGSVIRHPAPKPLFSNTKPQPCQWPASSGYMRTLCGLEVRRPVGECTRLYWRTRAVDVEARAVLRLYDG